MENNNTVQEFLNEMFGEVRVTTINNEIWFVATDIARILEYKTANEVVRNLNKSERKFTKIETKGGIQKLLIINKEGLHNILTITRKVDLEKKRKIFKWLTNLNYDKSLNNTCNEIEFISKLEEILLNFNIQGIKQYKIMNYKIDYFIPELNIAIEYDERNHSGYTYAEQEGRQREIEEELGCRFIRVSDKNSDINNAYFVFINITEELHTFIKSKINNDNLGIYAKALTVTKIEYEKLNIEDDKTLDEQLFETQIKYSFLKFQKERIEQLTKENTELRKSRESQIGKHI